MAGLFEQDLGDPILTIPAAIQSKSYYNPPGSDSHKTLIRLGDADTIIAESPLSIKAARYCIARALSCIHLSDSLPGCPFSVQSNWILPSSTYH